VCGPTSRWFTRQRLGGWTNSIGSSTVRMWASQVWLMRSTMAASVVDFPEPVGPVTSTRPRSRVQSSFRTGGKLSDSRVGIAVGIVRSTAPGPRLWTKAFTRKRPLPGTSQAKSISCSAWKVCRCSSLMIEFTRAVTPAALSAGCSVRVRSPWMRIRGGRPALRWRSEAPRSAVSRSSSSIVRMAGDDARRGPGGGRRFLAGRCAGVRHGSAAVSSAGRSRGAAGDQACGSVAGMMRTRRRSFPRRS